MVTLAARFVNCGTRFRLRRREDGSVKLTDLFNTAETPAEASAGRLYRHAVEQARQPGFYLHHAVEDTPDGRFDMITLHVVLILRRLKRDHHRTEWLAQALFDLMFADMDQNLRELGVGDMSVGKRIKAMAKGFYGRLAAYDAGLDAPEGDTLEAALRRNLYRKTSPPAAAVTTMADYVRVQADRLAAQSTDALVAGEVAFGAPPAATGDNDSHGNRIGAGDR